MDINFFRKWLLITTTILIFGCTKDNESSKPYRNVRYSFEASAKFSPQQENYFLGDTIFLESEIETNLRDLISNKMIDYSNCLPIGGNFVIRLFDTIQKKAVDSPNIFKIIPFIGTNSLLDNNSNFGINIFYQFSQSKFKIKMGLVCKKRGYYLIGMTDLGSQGIKGKDCTNSGFDLTIINSNKNMHLFPNMFGFQPDYYVIKYGYCLRTI